MYFSLITQYRLFSSLFARDVSNRLEDTRHNEWQQRPYKRVLSFREIPLTVNWLPNFPLPFLQGAGCPIFCCTFFLSGCPNFRCPFPLPYLPFTAMAPWCSLNKYRIVLWYKVTIQTAWSVAQNTVRLVSIHPYFVFYRKFDEKK